ncbi:hypothetical protein FNF29_03728 [Cafeteria roenbergensis]|uniref:Uncharacterized protein n=1 Tax=Cafeteria roenbergensis TaxID=33653 RepID=A0A5A8D415_CAFRO|nr:hypothetical protein FNF29_03728 [Cafeteria roenbergensis]KAA0160106.1 hypothetical protein FNF31_04572 [Cafeteria roenbergensis]|eukprot:KAA0152501.1 hypothetical protein FNF29_03728 [Cafeteria roenbergensis]
MGRITIFVKSRCKYCEKLRAFIKEAVQAHVLPFRNQLKPYYGIELCLVNVSADAARSAQCIALTGSRTVPQAFLNEEHIGNERTCTVFDQCGELAKKLRSLATKPSAAFPPEPEAAFVKLTSDMAFASQPTLAQIRGLSEFGFQSVVNLVHERERGHLRSEGVVATAAGLQYLPAAPREPPSIPISHIEVDVIPGLPMPGSGTVPPCLGGRASQGTCQAPSRADAETKESSGSTAASMASHRRRRHVGRRLSADDAAGAKAALEAAAAAAESHPCPAAGHGGMSGPETCCPRAGDAYDARLDLDLEEVGGGGGGAGGGAGGGRAGAAPSNQPLAPGVWEVARAASGGLATGPGPSTGQAPLDAIIEEEEAAAATRGVTVEDWGSPPASARCRIGASTGGTSVATPVSGDGSGSPGRGGGTRGCSEGPSDPPVARSVTASSGTAPFGPEDAGPRGSVKKAPRDQGEEQQDDSDAADGKADSDESAPRDSPLGSRRPTGASSGAPESATGVAASDAGHTVSSFEPSTVWTMRHDDLAGRPALAMRAVRGAASGSAAESGDSGGAVARRFLRDAMSAAPSEAATLDSPRLGPFGASRTPDFGPAEPPMLADVHPPGEEDGPVWTPEWCRAAIEKVDAARKPVLVHCQTGVAACAVCLIRAARQLKSTPKQVARWAADLGHRIADHGDLEQCVAVLLSEA